MAARKKKTAKKSAARRPADQRQSTAKKKAAKKKAPKRKGSRYPKGETPEALKATTWKPGQSGNPAGRKPGLTLEERFLKLLATKVPDSVTKELPEGLERFDQIAIQVYALICAGDPTALREIIKRLWPVDQNVNITGEVEVGAGGDLLDLLTEKLIALKRGDRDIEIDLPGGA